MDEERDKLDSWCPSVRKITGFESLTSYINMLNEIFSFLPGGTIIHKIAVLNKQMRAFLKIYSFLWD